MLLWYVLILAGTLSAFFLGFLLYFRRDPDRKTPPGPNVVSPADGRIIAIKRISGKKVDIKKGIGRLRSLASDVPHAKYLISIFMSPLDVHVQRAPINGRIAKVRHQKGSFLPANTLKALRNENNEILFEDLDISVKVIQIAGLIARRIECFVKKGDHLVKGERIGRINLGSQVALIVPEQVDLRVKTGQRVRAGETIMGVII